MPRNHNNKYASEKFKQKKETPRPHASGENIINALRRRDINFFLLPVELRNRLRSKRPMGLVNYLQEPGIVEFLKFSEQKISASEYAIMQYMREQREKTKEMVERSYQNLKGKGAK